ncbi:flagellar basal body rod protein FlgC [Pelagibius sp.]|uniref:flagellar basal body rod protein FlgC n=1 Tax=Pelagibius sp. TaxID=1931238 RepID=UPI003460577F
MAVSAANVANMRSRGVDPEGPAQQPGAYGPGRVQEVSVPGGGVRGEVRPITPASVQTYEPGSPDADAEGLVDRPNVNLAEELVTQMQAQRAYEANAAALRTQDEVTKSLLDIKS